MAYFSISMLIKWVTEKIIFSYEKGSIKLFGYRLEPMKKEIHSAPSSVSV